MLGLPQRTELNVRLNKTDIYTKFNFDKKQQDLFDTDISMLYIVNEISEYSIGVSSGKEISAIHVFRVIVKKKNYNDSNIIKLFKLIENKILLALQFKDEIQIVAYQTKLLKSNWMHQDSAVIELKGLNLDTVWKNIVKSLEGGEWNEELSIDENIALHEKQIKLRKEIERLEKMARNEKQPRKKFELVQKIKELKSMHNS